MANYNFVKDLRVANETEKEVADLIELHFGLSIKEIGETGAYDILASGPNGLIKFEVKEDFIVQDTGNVALEYECRGKPSGIATTEADYYIYKLNYDNGPEYVIHSVGELKEMIEKGLYFRDVIGGDWGSRTKMYLFKKRVFVKHGKRVFHKHKTGLHLPLTK